MSRSQEKVMVIPFFDSQGLIHVEWVPQGQTINKEFYLTVLRRFREKMRKKRPQQWTSGQGGSIRIIPHVTNQCWLPRGWLKGA